MRRLATFLLTVFVLMPLSAQDWGLNWISAPWQSDTDQVWFSRGFSLSAKPGKARVEVASSGHFQLFINELNVTTRLLEPFAQQGEDTLHVVSYDVKPFLRQGFNSLRVWFSPTCSSPKQLSLTLVAEMGRRRFVLTTDGSWLCTYAHARTFADGHEEVDGRYHIKKPASVALWQPAKEQKNVSPSFRMADFIGKTPYEVRSFTCSMMEADTTQSRVCTYRCGLAFEGRVSVSLTGMKAGDTLRVNRHVYVCNGRDGEQALQRFAIGESGTVRIEGPARFSANNVDLVEAILIRPLAELGARPFPAGHLSAYDDEPIVFLDERDDD